MASLSSQWVRALRPGPRFGPVFAMLPRQAALLRRRACKSCLSTIQPSSSIIIDRSGLLGHKRSDAPSPASPGSGAPSSQGQLGFTFTDKETKLGELLKSMILMRGPMTIAEWMRVCLGHPEHGYYMTRDVFGRAGDFTTSPEISQLFGELVGVWLIATLQQLDAAAAGVGKAERKVALVEVGPGRGTLCLDVLRVFSRFPSIQARLSSVHLVETSRAMRRIQGETLQCAGHGEREGGVAGPASPVPGVHVLWHDRLVDARAAVTGSPSPPSAEPPVILMLAHELFDALPTHQLVWCGRDTGWRERLVDVAHQDGEGSAAGQLLLPSPTPLPVPPLLRRSSSSPSFSLVRAGGPTPASAAYAAWRKDKDSASSAEPKEGDVAEFSPASIDLARQMADWLSPSPASAGGAALLIDYGYSPALGVDGHERGEPHRGMWTLRGIQRHAFVPFLTAPGATDLSVDVDFGALASAVSAVKEEAGGVASFGPITQGVFLQRMGLGVRLQRLLDSPAALADPALRDRLIGEATRLASPAAMGSVYKVMAVTGSGGGRGMEGGAPPPPPPAFESFPLPSVH